MKPASRAKVIGQPSIIDAMSDVRLFGQWFRGDSWKPWRSFLRAAYALPMDDADLELFRRCTGRRRPPSEPVREWWGLVGRRDAKSLISSLCGCHAALLCGSYADYLAPGERATVMLLAGDKNQARTLMRYCKGLVQGSPLLAGKIENETQWTLDFRNRTTIEVCVANPRSTRGYTLAAVVADELATWATDELSPKRDEDTLAALRPAMLTIPHAKLICISSPYARKGAVWNAYRKHFGQDESKVLIWQAATEVMNPVVDRDLIAEAYADDPESAAAEYGALFRRDISAYLSQEVLDACTARGRHELPPMAGVRYMAFCDPSGGSSDSYTLAIAHKDGNRAILDCLREAVPPFSAEAITAEFADVCRTFNKVTTIRGDKYAGIFPRQLWANHGITYVTSDQSKSDIYRELIPALNAHRIELLDNKRLLHQLLGLERRTGRGTGREVIDHGPHSKDDAANAACGALLMCIAGRQPMKISDEALRQSMIPAGMGPLRRPLVYIP